MTDDEATTKAAALLPAIGQRETATATIVVGPIVTGDNDTDRPVFSFVLRLTGGQPGPRFPVVLLTAVPSPDDDDYQWAVLGGSADGPYDPASPCF